MSLDWQIVSDSLGRLNVIWDTKSVSNSPSVKFSCDSCSYGTNLAFGISRNFVVTLNTDNVLTWHERWDMKYIKSVTTNDGQLQAAYGI